MPRSLQLIEFFFRIIHIRLFNRTNRDVATRREIYHSFRYLGGVYIKFLQVMVLNGDFLKGWGGPAELAIFESLPYQSIDPKKIIRDELGAAGLARFKSIKPKPFATGSFAQVYEATLVDGSHVIVKILRPNLIKTLKKDLRALTFFVRLMSLFRTSSMIDVKHLFGNFASMTLAEVDYEAEVKKAKWFWDYYKKSDTIVVPWTYEELSSQSIITQDYIGGISLAELMAEDQSGENPAITCQEKLSSDFWYLLEFLGEEFVHSTVWSEYMFGDPHPGNLKILPNNQIGIIDFGLVVETGQNKLAYLELLEAYKGLYDNKFDPAHFTMAFISFFDESLAKSLRQVEKYVSKETGESMMDRIGESAARNFMDHVGQGVGSEAIDRKRIAEVFFNAINDGNRYGLKMDPETAGMMKSAGAYMFMLRKFSHNNEEEQIMSRVIGREVEYAKANLGRLQSKSAPEVSFEEAIEILGDWLTQVADRDPRLYYNLSRSLTNGYA
jgi:predicted unusual protein kinase regulating ubiquinone biosynthesis (AarF/ABC1/UbiB family)